MAPIGIVTESPVQWSQVSVVAGRFGGCRMPVREILGLRIPQDGAAVEVRIERTIHEFWGGDLERVALSVNDRVLDLVLRNGDWFTLRIEQGRFCDDVVTGIQGRIDDAHSLALEAAHLTWRRPVDIARQLDACVAREGFRMGERDWAGLAFEMVNHSANRFDRLLDDLAMSTGDPVVDCRRAWLIYQLAPCFSGDLRDPQPLSGIGACAGAAVGARRALTLLMQEGAAECVDLGSWFLAVCECDPCVVLSALRLVADTECQTLAMAAEAARELLVDMDFDLEAAVRACGRPTP